MDSNVDPNLLTDSYEKLFCPRCFIFDCRAHGHSQARPHRVFNKRALGTAGLSPAATGIAVLAAAAAIPPTGRTSSSNSNSHSNGMSNDPAQPLERRMLSEAELLAAEQHAAAAAGDPGPAPLLSAT